MATHASTFAPAGDANLARLALQADGALCATMGVGLLAGAAPVADFTGLPLAVPVVLGVGLIPYGVGLIALARRRATRGSLLTIAALNLAWVIASALLLLTGAASLTTGGSWAVGIIALIVADLAALQLYAARKA
jgi:hypothetical protein